MSDANDLDRLYRLLPANHQMRDAEQGYPLRALLRLIGRECQVLEDDLTQLYEGWFIETCPEWVVPYIGELVGYSPAPEAGDPGNMDLRDPLGRARVLIPRRDVANAIRHRRRKGTLALLSDLARDAAGWPARPVEFFRALAWMQNLNFLHLHRGKTIDVRQGRKLALLDGPFNEGAHSVDVRRPNSTLTPGRYNIPNVGLFICRLHAYTVTRSRAKCRQTKAGAHCYSFSALGNDTPLFNCPQPGADATRIAGPLDLPIPITRRDFEERLPDDPLRQPPISSIASADYYGLDKSLAIWAPGWPQASSPQPVPRQNVIPADLSDWKYLAPNNYVAVDPELGRIVFPPGQLPKISVSVSYAYGFAAPIGGGEYDRPLMERSGAVIYRVGRNRPGAADSIQTALKLWRNTSPRPKAAVIEIIDSEVYTDHNEPFDIKLDEDEDLQIRAANRARPIIILLESVTDLPESFLVQGGRGSRLTLDGLLITGRGLVVQGPGLQDEGSLDDDLCEVVIRHSTLVPGLGLSQDCEPIWNAKPSLEIIGSQARIVIDHAILGSIVVQADQVRSEPICINLNDSILDSTGHDCDKPECEALTGIGGQIAHAVASFQRCTVFGRVHSHAIRLAENSIFTGQVRVARRQLGCVRFCSLPPGSRTPRRYECQPDKVTLNLTPAEAALEALRVRPQFLSTRYGTPYYARLAADCAPEILRGADDQSEMGVYHDLYEPQRAALLRQRLQEFTPAGMDAGLIFIT